MKLCVLGNSHIAALKISYDQFSKDVKNNLNCTFFASRGAGLQGLYAHNDRLICKNEQLSKDLRFTAGGIDLVDPDNFDVFLIHGLGFTYPYHLFTECFYSQAFMLASVKESWQKRVFFRLYQELRKITTKPILITPQPYVSEADHVSQRSILSSPSVLLDMQDLTHHFSEHLDAATTFLKQPTQTTCNAVFTLQKYSTDSIRLDVGDLTPENSKHKPHDYLHMNSLYGEQVWQGLFQQLYELTRD